MRRSCELRCRLMLLVATCFVEHAGAFVHLRPVTMERIRSDVNSKNDGLHRLHTPSTSMVQSKVSMRDKSRSIAEQEYHFEDHDTHPLGADDSRLSRLDFGLRLGAASAALLLSGPRASSADGAADLADAASDTAEEVAQVESPVASSASPVSAPDTGPLRDLGFEVPYTGKALPLNKFLGGKATLVVNPKIDDPESLHQMPGITKLAAEYSNQGLNVLLFPTDQGTFEADEDRVVRIKFYQFYGFGQYPKAVVFDKVDIVGSTIHPFYRYLCRGLKNPNGIARITLNYEKFLLDKDGTVVRRYPRKLEAADFEQDVKALLADQPLPPENRDFKLSWLKADQEAIKSEYAFKLGLNYYNNT